MQQNLSINFILAVIVAYFTLLAVISIKTSGKSDNENFYIGSRNSPWYVVAFGMIGASLSGVTFISLPGMVYNSQFSYMQMVLGYGLGYMVISLILIPLYYKKNLISIYGYLNERYGNYTQKTGSGFFIISRLIGSSFRLYLMTMVLHDFIFVHYGIPFWLTVLVSLLLIWSYTVKSGIKTIIWTDTLQTLFMILALVLALIMISAEMDLSLLSMIQTIKHSDYSQTLFFEHGWSDPQNFIKQFLSGALIAIVMTGLDQDMMQKNISCKNVKESQKNIKWFYIILFIVNMMFLLLGALLYIYADNQNIDLLYNEVNGKTVLATDKVFPLIAFEHLPFYFSAIFLIGLLAAAYSSADSALTSLTTSFCLDILKDKNIKSHKRMMIHFAFTIVIFITIVSFRYLLESSAINGLFVLAGYTYGPLLGLFAFGLISKKRARDKMIPILAIAAPVVTFIINKYSQELLFGYKFGYELLLINGLIMYISLYLFSKKQNKQNSL